MRPQLPGSCIPIGRTASESRWERNLGIGGKRPPITLPGKTGLSPGREQAKTKKDCNRTREKQHRHGVLTDGEGSSAGLHFFDNE